MIFRTQSFIFNNIIIQTKFYKLISYSLNKVPSQYQGNVLFINIYSMIYTRHSHCFSKCQLQAIIDDYLTLGPYYKVLLQALKINLKRFQEQQNHPKQKPHPIKIYTKDYQSTRNQLQIEEEEGENKTDIRTTYASSGNIRFFYIFPLEYVSQIIESAQFFALLPKNIIINGLLTTTNLQIIIETLTIVSEEMSKNIRSTIAGKELRSNKPSRKNSQIMESPTTVQLKEASVHSLAFQSKIEIQIEEENDFDTKKNVEKTEKIDKKETKKRLVKKAITGTNRILNIDVEVAEQQCRFCQGYLIYLYETVGQNPLDDDINRLTNQSFRCLKLISRAVPHFTMYLTETNQTHVPNDIHTINKILNSMGIVITEQIFASELNPKMAKTSIEPILKPQNLIQQLQPYFDLKKRKANPNIFSVEELFRMLIYSPSTKEVKQQLKQQKAEQFEKNQLFFRIDPDQKDRDLLFKQCVDMKQFQAERMTIHQHTVDTKPIYKQLQSGQEPPNPPAAPTNKINHYNAYTPSRNMTKTTTQERLATNHLTLSKIDNKTSKELGSPLPKETKFLKKKSSKNYKNGKKIKQNKEKENDLQYAQFNTLALSTVFKKNIIKPQNSLNAHSQTTVVTNQLSSSLEYQNFSTKKSNFQTEEDENQLSDQQFRKIMYNAFLRKNNVLKNQVHCLSPTPSTPQPHSAQSSNLFKAQAKKFVGYGSTFSHFIGKKQEQEEMDCIQKQQKQLYNKQLLNGQFIKNEIQDELNNGSAEVFADFYSIVNLKDTFKLDKRLLKETQKETTESTGRVKWPRKGSRTNLNLISKNSLKYNQSGLIRNQKYNKSIKIELMNNRQSYLESTERENISKNHLSSKNGRKGKGQQKMSVFIQNINEQYDKELKSLFQTRKQVEKWERLMQY